MGDDDRKQIASLPITVLRTYRNTSRIMAVVLSATGLAGLLVEGEMGGKLILFGILALMGALVLGVSGVLTLVVRRVAARELSTTRFEAAAERVLQGDESRKAADLLAGVVLEDYPGDERLEELLYALSLYSPGSGAPYFDAVELREALSRSLTFIDGSADGE